MVVRLLACVVFVTYAGKAGYQYLSFLKLQRSTGPDVLSQVGPVLKVNFVFWCVVALSMLALAANPRTWMAQWLETNIGRGMFGAVGLIFASYDVLQQIGMKMGAPEVPVFWGLLLPPLVAALICAYLLVASLIKEMSNESPVA